MKNKALRIFIIEPSPLVTAGLRSILGAHSSLQVVGEFPDTNRIPEKLATLRPDLVVINPTVVDFHKRGSIRQLFPDIPVVALLYTYLGHDTLQQFQGVIELYDLPVRILETLRSAASDPVAEENIQDGEELSEREKEILTAVVKGMMNKEIASLHHISIHTVISHRKNISRKTGIKSVSGLVVYAMLNGLMEPEGIAPLP